MPPREGSESRQAKTRSLIESAKRSGEILTIEHLGTSPLHKTYFILAELFHSRFGCLDDGSLEFVAMDNHFHCVTPIVTRNLESRVVAHFLELFVEFVMFFLDFLHVIDREVFIEEALTPEHDNFPLKHEFLQGVVTWFANQARGYYSSV